MKRFLIAAATLACVAVYAQDTTKHRPIAIDTASGSGAGPAVVKPRETSPARTSDEYRDAERVLVQPDEVPVPVQESLRAPQYAGWENFSIFQDRITGDYLVEMKKGSAGTKVYRFDKNGKLLDDANSPRKKE